jgi:hypothetical protein
MHSEISPNESPTVEPRTLPFVSKNLGMNYIENALLKAKGKTKLEVASLGISWFTLERQMVKPGINSDDYK